jgi:hypothetical protein
MSTVPALIDDDEATLYRLTKPSEDDDVGDRQNQNQHQNDYQNQPITLNHFQDLSSRFIEDITSPICIKSHDEFWKSLLSSAQSLGFTHQYQQQQSSSLKTVNANVNTNINFDSNAGKSHLDAVTSLLGVSVPCAKVLTSNVITRLEDEKRKTDVSTNENSGDDTTKNTTTTNDSSSTSASASALASLLGTKKLLILVRNYHYEQQISRIRFIAESLRREQADDENEEIQESCRQFLTDLDSRQSYTELGGGGLRMSRGLLKVLLCIACAPVTALGRNELYQSVALLGESHDNDHHNDNDGVDNNFNEKRNIFKGIIHKNPKSQGSKESQHVFAKKMIERHEEHYGSTLRTEALEAIFMLLYTRIDGGIHRSDYLLLLLAFEGQNFYVQGDNMNMQQKRQQNKKGMTGMKRRSQLTALILAECMSLWHATNNNRMTDSNHDWIETHPFLCGHDSNSIVTELNMIGKLLLEKYGYQLLINLQNQSMIMDGDGGFKKEVEAPESIAILTFGLLLKMAHNSSIGSTGSSTSLTSGWASEIPTKDLATKCISMGNDECGAFDYLGSIMSCFLPVSSGMNIMKKNHKAYVDSDWREELLSQSQKSDGPLRLTNGEVGYSNDVSEEDGTIISYASIGREILVGTLCAFRNSISISNKDNVITLCKLAAKIYRNNDAMCSQFWSDWASESESRDNIGLTDPMCHLLDVAYQIANSAITNAVNPNDNLNSTSLNCGRFAASILPSLQPLLSFISSLMSRDGNTLHQILQAFLSNGIIHASLLGCLHLCTTEETSVVAYQTSVDYQTLLEAAKMTMISLNTIAGLIQEDDGDSAAFLRAALAPVSTNENFNLWQGNGAQLLHKIATSSHRKLLHKMETSAPHALDPEIQSCSEIISSSLSIMTSLLQCKSSDDLIWIDHVAKCFIGKTDRVDSFGTSGLGKVTSSFMQLIYFMSCNVTTIVMSKATQNETALNYLNVIANGAIVACQIISSSSLTEDLTNQEVTTLCHSMWTLQTLMRSLNGIATSHNDGDIGNSARLVRDSIINNLTSSTALGTVIGFYATEPVSSGLGQIITRLSHSFNTDKRQDYCKILKKVSYQSVSTQSYLLDLSAAAMSLLVSWGQVAEQIAILNTTSSPFEVSLEEVSGTLSTEQLKRLSSQLASLGPSRLLLSLAEPPHKLDESLTTQWEQSDTSLLTLISRFIGWTVETNDDHANELAVKALKLIVMTLCHSNITVIHNRRVIDTVLGKETVRCVGAQLNLALESLMNQTQIIYGTKRFSVLLNLLDLLQCCTSLQPLLAKEIISGSENSSLINYLEMKLEVTESSSIEDILLNASLARVVYQLWKSCREQCDSAKMLSVKFHPCDEIVSSLSTEGRVYKQIIAILLEYPFLLGQDTSGLNDNMGSTSRSEKSLIAYKRSKMLETFGSAVEIIMLELMLHLRNTKGNQLPDTVKHFLATTSDQELLKLWFQSLSFDSIIAYARANNDFFESLPSSNVNFSKNALDCTYCAIHIMNETRLSNSGSAIENILRSSHASKQLAETQVQLISSLSTCGEILHAYHQSINTHQSNSGLEVLFRQVEQAAMLYSKSITEYSQALSLLPLSTHQNIHSQAAEISRSLMNYLVISMPSITTSNTDQSSRFLGILEEILDACERILENLNSDPELRLRLYTMLLTSLAIDTIKKGNNSITYDDRKKFSKSRLKCCRLACEILELLKKYDCSMVRNGDNPHIAYLMQTTFTCLTLLIPSSDEDVPESSLSTQAYRIDLINTLRNCGAVPLLMYHLKTLSNSTARFENSNTYGMIETQGNGFALDMITIILNLSASLAESGSVEMSHLLLENHFINFLTTTPILLNASKKWTSLPQAKSNLRGYVEKRQLSQIPVGGSHQQYGNRSTDPLHDIWRSAVRTVASLACSTNIFASKGFITPHLREGHTVALIDFVRTFELNIDILLENFKQVPPQNDSLGNSASEFGYNLAFLNEACDVLSLVSELCSEGHKKVFEAKAPKLFSKFLSHSMYVIISLSSFLGAVGTSRELFSLLSNLNQIIDNDADDAIIAMHQRFASHPLLAEGVSNGKHEAIRHALYANSYCVCVTEEEYTLSQSEAQLNSSPASSNLEQKVQNDFVLHMETIAGQCISNVLSILTKIHPASSSFMPFSEAEAEKLRLSSIPRKGTIVAIRPKSYCANNILAQLNTTTKSFARVIDFDEIKKTLDVIYMGETGNVIERDVKLSRLAGIEDVTKRMNLFQYRSAPETICHASVEHKSIGSIGHLIQILRWCRQHVSIQQGTKGDRSRYISEEIVKCIAETVLILLGNEISLHLELRSPSSTPNYEVQNINRQLFDLLSEEDDLLIQEFNLTTNATTTTTSIDDDSVTKQNGKKGLEKLVDINIWKSAQQQLSVSLAAARVEKENIRKSTEQTGNSTLGWRTTTSTLHNSRRSPFK